MARRDVELRVAAKIAISRVTSANLSEIVPSCYYSQEWGNWSTSQILKDVMYSVLFLILMFAGCASFAAIDLRPSDPPELGDLYGYESTSVRYRVMAIDPNYVENRSRLECVNTMTESRARCRSGDRCLAMRRVDSGADRMQEPVCMLESYVMEIYSIEHRAEGMFRTDGRGRTNQ